MSNICGELTVDKREKKLWLFRHLRGLVKQPWTPMDSVIALSRRKQGFESPRERHPDQSALFRLMKFARIVPLMSEWDT
jgi:hypothetical protein